MVVKRNDKIFSFNDLQKRIGRKKVSSKMLQSYPIHLIAYDILFLDNLDCRHLKLKERRKSSNPLLLF